MKINEVNAKAMFKKMYPGGVGYDFTGRRMVYENYGRTDLASGWSIDHKLPQSKGGSDDIGNLHCTNIVTNEVKGDKTTWQDAGKTWQVVKVKGKKNTYKIVEIHQ